MSIQYIDIVSGEDKTWTHAVTGATRANPCVVTLTAHPFQVGDRIYFSGMAGMTQLNLNTYTVTAIGANTVTINVDSSTFGVYTSGGTATLYRRVITGATQANPCVISCPTHGFTNGQQVYFTDVGGMTELNGNVYTVANAAANTFELSGINSTAYTAYTTGGTVARPYLTYAFAFGDANNRIATSGDVLRTAKTTAATTHMLGNCTWTIGSATVTTDVSYASTVSVGDLIGIPTAAGNGADESFYKVVSRTGTQIILEGSYGGPATVTVGGIKIQPVVATGPSPGVACNITRSCTVSGGWTLSPTPTQDGETWLKPTGAKTASTNYCFGIVASGVTIDKMNAADGYYALTGSSAASIIQYCTLTAAYVYTVYALSATTAYNTVRVGHNAGPSWYAFNHGAAGTFTNVVITGYAGATSQTVAVPANTTWDMSSGCYVRGAGYGITMSASNSILKGLNVVRCQYGIQIAGSNNAAVVDSCNISYSAVYGIFTTSATQGILIKNCVLDQNSRAIYLGQAHGCRIEGTTMSNSTNYDIDADVYSGHIWSVGNSHITPGIRAYNRAASTAPIYIVGCTIDAGSTGKTFAQTVTDNAITPQYYVQDSFFGITGQYYGRVEVVKNSLTSPPSVQLKFNTTTTNYYTERKIASTYAKAGVAKTLGFKLTSVSAGWTGTLIPKIKLNGTVISTQATISSISYGSDDTYSYSLTGGQITTDGELSIEFLANANTVAVLIKEFTVS